MFVSVYPVFLAPFTFPAALFAYFSQIGANQWANKYTDHHLRTTLRNDEKKNRLSVVSIVLLFLWAVVVVVVFSVNMEMGPTIGTLIHAVHNKRELYCLFVARNKITFNFKLGKEVDLPTF